MARIQYLFDNMGSAAASQFLYEELCADDKRIEGFTASSRAAAIRNGSAPTSRLTFEPLCLVDRLDQPANFARLISFLEDHQFYYVGLFGKEIPHGTICSCFASAREPKEIGHAVTFAYRATDTCSFFDVNYGEFSIGQHQFARFLVDLWASYGRSHMIYERCLVYRIERAADFAAAHLQLGRNWDYDRPN